jgi:hypothetical protein
MSLKLEELRQRLLKSHSVNPSLDARHRSLKQVSSKYLVVTRERPLRGQDEEADGESTLDYEECNAPNSAEIASSIASKSDGLAVPVGQPSTDLDVSPASTSRSNSRTDISPTDELAQAIKALFEPARQCQRRLGEITQSCQVINELASATLELCQPLQTFGDRLRRISKALLSMRGFREELGVLSEFFEPIDVLNKQITQLEVAIQAQLAEIATTPDLTKTLKARIAELDQSVDSVSELENRFLELARCFGDTLASPNDQ